MCTSYFKCVNTLISAFRLEVIERTGEYVAVQSGQNRAVIYAAPFRVDLFSGDQLVVSANARGLMKFEHIQERKSR